MPDALHLPNAPIREALLDIRVDLPPEFSAIQFKPLHTEVGPKTYPKVVEGSKFEANLQLDAAGKFSSQDSSATALHAILFFSADERTVAQFRTDGFTLNKLRPYTKWESIFPEAMRLWQLYLRTAAPASVSKVALRYINEFSLPTPVASLGRYLHSVPENPPGTPGDIRGYLSRVSTVDEKTNLASTVTYAVNQDGNGSHFRVIFDIDVAFDSVLGTTTNVLTPVFARLRQTKNDIFFQSLTDQTLSLFL